MSFSLDITTEKRTLETTAPSDDGDILVYIPKLVLVWNIKEGSGKNGGGGGKRYFGID